MTKLAQIIDAATGEEVSAASLLRMVKVVAARLGTVPLEEWVNRELGGYDDADALPAYRGPFPAQVLGHFSGPFGSEVRNLPLPSVGLPKDYRDGWLFQVAFLQPISELEVLSRADRPLQNGWTADAVAMVNHLLESGEARLVPMHGLVSAHKVVSPQQVRAIVDAVRTRVLNLALDLESIVPQAGEPDAAPADLSRVTTVVHNNIYGDGNNLSVSSPGSQQSSHVVKQGDLPALLRAAADAGLPVEEVDALRDALQQDEAVGAVDGPGPEVQKLMGRLALTTGSVGGKVGIGAAGSVVGGLIRAYYGI